jgi:hypothetical protein
MRHLLDKLPRNVNFQSRKSLNANPFKFSDCPGWDFDLPHALIDVTFSSRGVEPSVWDR